MGRPKGLPKSGGRQKGSPNKRTADLQAAVEASGETPVDYMLRVMRDKTVDHDRRDDMAKAVAPYIHAKLAALQVAGDPDNPLVIEVVRFADSNS
jgi:hypothetical protein